MELLSLQKTLNKLKNVITRFPIVSMLALVVNLLSILLIEIDSKLGSVYLINSLLTAILAVPLFLSSYLFIEKYKLSKHYADISQISVFIFLIIYFFLLPNNTEDYSYEKISIRFTLLAIAFTLAITFTPFLEKQKINSFWQYNKTIFLRIFFSTLYSTILFIGFSLALVSIEQLFDIDINHDRYPELWITLHCLFSVNFFLAGLPKNFKLLEKQKDYPKGISFFVKFILVPIITVYSSILFVYTMKILITGEWPQGTVSWLIIMFSILSIIIYFLLYPLKNSLKWINNFAKGLFILLITFSFVLFTAIWIRISEYGLTEARYYVVALGLWILGISLYFLFSKEKNIKYIPISLFIIVLFSSFGPWGALTMSENNQFYRLKTVLQKNKILVQEKIITTNKKVSKKDLRQISAILEYLSRVHGYEKINLWFNQDLPQYLKIARNKNLNKLAECYSDTCFIMQLMNLEYISHWDYQNNDESENKFRSFTTEKNDFNISGYNYLWSDVYLSTNHFEEQNYILDNNYKINLYNNKIIQILKSSQPIADFDLKKISDDLFQKHGSRNDHVKIEEMTFVSKDSNVKIIIKQLHTENKNDQFEILNANFNILLK